MSKLRFGWYQKKLILNIYNVVVFWNIIVLQIYNFIVFGVSRIFKCKILIVMIYEIWEMYHLFALFMSYVLKSTHTLFDIITFRWKQRLLNLFYFKSLDYNWTFDPLIQFWYHDVWLKSNFIQFMLVKIISFWIKERKICKKNSYRIYNVIVIL